MTQHPHGVGDGVPTHGTAILQDALDDPEMLVREHATWALRRIE